MPLDLPDSIEIGAFYAVDLAQGTWWAPHGRDPSLSLRDPADRWVVFVARDRRIVAARPAMRAIGAAMGAAGLLSDERALRELCKLPYHPERIVPAGEPPRELELFVLERLA